MPDCDTCGRGLGISGVFGKDTCDDCVRRKSEEEEAARQQAILHHQQKLRAFEAVLQELIDGVRPVDELSPVILQARRDISAQDRRPIQDGKFRQYAIHLIEDNMLDEVEEDNLYLIADALEVTDQLLVSIHRDIFDRLRIARLADGRLPVADQPSILLKRGEVAYAEVSASLLKEVIQREYQGGNVGLSIPIMKAVGLGGIPGLGSLRAYGGRSRGRSVVVGTSIEVADTGTLSVTSKRTVFRGTKQSLEMAHSRLLDITTYSDAIQFHLSNRKSSPFISLEDSSVVAAMIVVAAQIN